MPPTISDENSCEFEFIVTVPVLVKSPVVVKEPSLEIVKVAPVATETEFAEASELTIG